MFNGWAHLAALGGAPPGMAAAAALASLLIAVALAAALRARSAKRPPAAALPFPVVDDAATWTPAFAAQREDAFNAVLDAHGAGGRTVVLQGAVATAHPPSVRALLLSRPHSLGRSWVYRALAWLMPSSDGILFMEGEDWRKRHSAFTPLLTGAGVRRYSLALFESSLSALAEYASRGGSGGSRAAGFDLLSAVREGAARFLLRFAFGAHPATPDARELEVHLDTYARTAFEVIPSVCGGWAKAVAYARLWVLARRLRLTVTRMLADGAFSVDASNAAYEAAAAAGASSPSPPPPQTLLARMVETPGEFTAAELIAEVNHLHGAHKAVAFVATCALTELSLPNPPAVEARAALTEEFTRVCGAPPRSARGLPVGQLMAQATAGHAAFARLQQAQQRGSGAAYPPPASLPHGWRPPDRSDLEEGRLPVLSRVWRETLRRHPVSMGVLRRTARPTDVDPARGAAARSVDAPDVEPAVVEGHPLPPGTDVTVLLHALHHDPRLWGPRANEWRPARWAAIDASRGGGSAASSGSGSSDDDVVPDPSQPLPFYPFLEGVRRCAGIHLAELEAAVMLYTWLVVGDARVTLPHELLPQRVPTDEAAADATAAPVFGSLPLLRARDPARHRVALVAVTAADGASQPSRRWKVGKRADMFSSLDGALPFTVAAGAVAVDEGGGVRSDAQRKH